MDPEYGPGARGHLLRDLPGRHEKVIVTICKDHISAGTDNRTGRCHEGVGRQYHFVSSTDTRGTERKFDRVRAIADSDGGGGVAVPGPRLLKRRDLGTEYEAALRNDAIESFAYGVRNLCLLPRKVYQRYKVRHVTSFNVVVCS
jgi:hypothetical protein